MTNGLRRIRRNLTKYFNQSLGWTGIVYSVLLFVLVVIGCTPSFRQNKSTPTALAGEIILYDWESDIPQAVLDAFTREYGVRVRYKTYESQEGIFDELQRGEVYDVVVLDSDILPIYTEADLLAELDYANLPNFKNIAANFRDLIYDPGNKYSIPYSYGTTGLVVRTDLVSEIPSRWSDLWDKQYAGKIGVRRDVPYDLIGITLKSLGYSINSEDDQELAEAEKKLMELRPRVILVGSTAEEAMPLMLDGTIAVLVGWSEDVWYGKPRNPAITYILPQEGTLLWGDNFVIPANSPNRYTAEVFLNFLLRPEISAQIVNYTYYATANEAAIPLVDRQIRSSTLVFPNADDLSKAEIFLPHTLEGKEKYQILWERFLAGGS